MCWFVASTISALPFDLRVVNCADLASKNPAVGKAVLQTLTSSLEAVQIVGIPGFEVARKEALSSLAGCLANDQGAPFVTMPDGSKRVSAGAGTKQGVASMMPSKCGDSSVELR